MTYFILVESVRGKIYKKNSDYEIIGNHTGVLWLEIIRVKVVMSEVIGFASHSFSNINYLRVLYHFL